MKPAEFRTVREGLGLSERDISMLTLVKEAQIKVWEKGTGDVPEGVSGLLMDIEREVARRVDQALARSDDRDEVVLKRFRNALEFRKTGPDMKPIPSMLAYRCHTVLVGRLYAEFRRRGRQVTVVYA